MQTPTRIIFAALLSPLLLAQAPSPRMARLTVTQGNVHIARADAPAGDPAQLNMPLVEGQSVVTGEDGQAEVEFEDGSVARLTPNSSLALTRLAASGGTDTQLALSHGLAYFELRSAASILFGVSAGDEHLSPIENTTLRVNLDQPPASIAVLSGSARLERRNGTSLALQSGESFRGDPADPARYYLSQDVAADTWDHWNETLDQQAADAAARQTGVRDTYADTQGYGWSDLDSQGTWYDVAGQGRIWQPEGGDAPDFDPYGNGSWVWYPIGGYIWASAYPWGWTPFRCGGWSFYDGFGWAWAPGAGCGGIGFAGGYGYGSGYGGSGRGGYINIVHGPPHHQLPRPPAPGHGGVHPIISVHTGLLRASRIPAEHHDPRWINGLVANPVPQASHGYTVRGGSLAGAPLHRDFPIDRATHTAVVGMQPGQSAQRERGDPPTTSVGGVITGTEPSFPSRAPSSGTLRPLPPAQSGTYVTAPQRAPQQVVRPYSPQPSRPSFNPAPVRASPPPAAAHPSASARAPAHTSAPAPAASGKK